MCVAADASANGMTGATMKRMTDGNAAFRRRIGLAGRIRYRCRLCTPDGHPAVQNIPIGMIERERARLRDGGLSEHGRYCERRQQGDSADSLERVHGHGSIPVGYPEE